jgi:hypothetical protein
VQNPEQAEEAVAHMCFLTDARQLYNNALGLYDLELTLLVAQQAQTVRHHHDAMCGLIAKVRIRGAKCLK